MLKKTVSIFLTLCTLFLLSSPVAYAEPSPTDNYTVETWDIDYYMNLTLVLKNETGELFDAPFDQPGNNEFMISLLGPTVLQVPEGWTIMTNPIFASGPDGTPAGEGIVFGPGSEVTFIDNDTFRAANADPAGCAFTAWFNGQIPAPPTTTNFSLADNGIIFEKDGAEIARVVLHDNLMKLYAPGQEIVFDITPAIDLSEYTLKVYLADTYAGGGLHSEEKQFSGADLTNVEQQSFISDINGVFTFTAELSGPDYSQKGTVDIGVIARNEKPDDGFYYGMQAIMYRPFYWGAEFAINGMGAEDSYRIIYEYLLYSGVNLVRDGPAYHDLSPSNDDNMRWLGTIIDELTADGITLDFVIAGTPEFAADPAYTDGDPWQRPPQEDLFRAFMEDLAGTFADNSYIIWEVYNEPNSAAFWTGGMDKYMNIVSIFSDVLITANKNAYIVNGGMVLDPNHLDLDPDNKYYYEQYATMLGKGLTNVAIHSHGSIESLHEHFNEVIVIPGSIPNESIFLNESGNMTKSDLIYQAKHLAGKLIYSKANGFAGFVAFHLGAADAEANNMTLENNGGPMIYDYGMVSDNLEPKPSYLAYMTAINMLNGAVPAGDDAIIQESDNAFAYLFRRGDTFIEINIGTIREPALDLDYVEYDMFGNKMLGNEGGAATEIVYRVYEAETSTTTVKVVYEGNGGSGRMASIEVPVGGSHVVASSSFARSNYTFTGWNTSRSGSGQNYQPGDTLNNVSEDIYLYAQWKADASGGGSSDSGGGGSGGSSGGNSESSSGGGNSNSTSSSADNYTRRTITDISTGVSVTGSFLADAKLVVQEKTLHPSGTCAVCDDIRARDEAGELIVLYDISIIGSYQGEIEVTIPVGDEYNGQRLTIIHCANKVFEEQELTAQNGVVTGIFSVLSPFGVLDSQDDTQGGTNSADQGNSDDAGTSIPQTGDTNNIPLWWLWILAALLVMAGCIGFLLWKRRRAKE